MKNLIPALCFLLLLTACEKDAEELPEATQTGANTFGARLDGALWTPQHFTSLGSSTILEALYTGSGDLLINARNFKSSPNETEFEIFIKNIAGPGTYPLNQPTAKYPLQSASYGYYIKRKFMPLNEWMTNATYPGSITISRIDTAAGVVSGTFAFNAACIDSSAGPITVTEGRFDIKLSN